MKQNMYLKKKTIIKIKRCMMYVSISNLSLNYVISIYVCMLNIYTLIHTTTPYTHSHYVIV